MNAAAAILAFRWLIRDTFRQARASGLSWLLLAASALCILVCLSVGVSGDQVLHRPGENAEFLSRVDGQADPSVAGASGANVVSGELTLGFGALKVPMGRDGPDAVHFLQLLLAGGVADTAGILLALIWTAGFLPAFLEPGTVLVILAKPLPRWTLLLGKYLGVLAFVAFQAAVFVVGTWLALGLKTGVWEPGYLLCVPLLLLHFGVFFSFSVFLAVWLRSTIACAVGSLGFWLLCWGVNYARHTVVALPHLDVTLAPLPTIVQATAEAGYWMLPKPADFGILLFQGLQAGNCFSSVPVFAEVQALGAFHPELSVLASLLFSVVMLFSAAWQLASGDS
jgi:hypothetical protein